MNGSKKSLPALSPEKKKELISTVITIVLILAIAGGILSAMYIPLANTIEETERQPFITAMKKICPADMYEPVELEFAEASRVYNMHRAYRGSEEIIGYCVESRAQTANGEMRIAVSADAEGKITAVEIISRGESDSSGTKDRDKEFLDQFVSKSGEITLARGMIKDNTQVREVIGMTVSAEVLCDGVSRASVVISHLKKGDVKEAAQ